MLQTHRKIMRILLASGYTAFFFCILVLILIGLGQGYRSTHLQLALMALLLLLSILTVLLTTYLTRSYAQNVEQQMENLSQLNLQLRSQRHEYLNEMQVVYGLMELGEYEEAYQFMRPIYREVSKTSRALKTSLPAVNALIQNKMGNAEEQGLHMVLDISSPLRGIPLEQWDVCRILGNLLDNAITAALQTSSQQGEVYLRISETPAQFELELRNNGPMIPENRHNLIFQNGVTSKKEEGHGYGLGIVRRILRLCDGTISLRSTEEETIFLVIIPRVAE